MPKTIPQTWREQALVLVQIDLPNQTKGCMFVRDVPEGTSTGRLQAPHDNMTAELKPFQERLRPRLTGCEAEERHGETYGLAKEGARHHGYTGARGYHPLLAIAAGTGEVLMSRLREGRANTARGGPPTSCVRRWGGCATAGPGDNSRCGPTAASTATLSLPPAGKWMSASLSPSASAPACGT